MTGPEGRGRRRLAVGAGLVLCLIGLALVGYSYRGSIKQRVKETVRPDPEPPAWVASVTTAPADPTGMVGAWSEVVGGRTPLAGFGEVKATVTAADGTVCEVCLLAALTPDQRATGLMYVTDPDLGGYDGMVFVFDADVSAGFWMRNTRLPLSIAYFDGDGVLVSTNDMEPCPDDEPNCPTYPASGPFRYAIEVPQGRLADIGVVGADGGVPEPRDAVLEITGNEASLKDGATISLSGCKAGSSG